VDYNGMADISSVVLSEVLHIHCSGWDWCCCVVERQWRWWECLRFVSGRWRNWLWRWRWWHWLV